MVIDSPADLVPIAVLATAVLGGILWLIRAQNAIGKQFKPNHGQSMRDSVDRIEKDTRDLRNRLDHHIDDHNKR
jgi:hypothetical protein